MKQVKVLGPGCAKCKLTYDNVLEAVQLSGVKAEVTKVEDIMEMMQYNVMTTPVLVIDEQVKIKGRIANVKEIRELLEA